VNGRSPFAGWRGLAGVILMFVGTVWVVHGLLMLTGGIYGNDVTIGPWSSPVVGIVCGLIFVGLGAGLAWGGFRLIPGRRRRK
jgi:threonine/homoserine/homoserine lactone efflux protein